MPIMTSVAVLLFTPKMQDVLSVASVLAVALALVGALTLYGRVDLFVVGWVFFFPLGYYFLTFPRENSLFTLDRGLTSILLVAMFLGLTHKDEEQPLTKSMTKAVVAWALFLVATFVSLRKLANPLGAAKEAADVFLFPAVLAYYVIRYLQLRRWLPAIHVVTCLMTCYVALIGGAELVTGQDLLPLPGAVFTEAIGTLQRVNGPFASNNSFGLVGLITLLFLIFLGRVLAHRLTAWKRVLHVAGVLSALSIAVMPMYRSIVVTLLVVIILELYCNKRITTRFAVVGLVLVGTAAVLGLGQLAPDLFENRVSDFSNLYGRIAQQKQTFELFVSHPVDGVGLGNYSEAASDIPDTYYRSVYSMGSAHNTLGAVLVDTGLIGFVPFVFAQVYFFLAFWKLRRQPSPHANLASRFFLYVFLAYWMSGLVLTSGYYSDLNFWYMFVSAVIYKFAVTTNTGLYAERPVDRHGVLRAVARAGVTTLC